MRPALLFCPVAPSMQSFDSSGTPPDESGNYKYDVRPARRGGGLAVGWQYHGCPAGAMSAMIMAASL